jgi:hypothetical protein
MSRYWITVQLDLVTSKYLHLDYDCHQQLYGAFRAAMNKRFPYAEFHEQRCDCGGICHDIKLQSSDVHRLIDELQNTQIEVKQGGTLLGHIDVYPKISF